MLASHITLASQAPNSAVFLSASATSGSILRSSRGYKSRTHQQTRNFRFGTWSSYLDPSYQKELQRRHRIIKHKYAEAVHRNLVWDRPRSGYSGRSGFKSFMCSAWRGQDPRPGGRWVDMDELEAARSRTRDPSKGIEEVEQNALDHLFSSQNTRAYDEHTQDPANERESKASHIRIRRGYNSRFCSRGLANQQDAYVKPSWMESGSNMDYEIDPITNRKVPRSVQPNPANNDKTEVPVKNFKGYRSQFMDSQSPVKNTSDSMQPKTGNAQRTNNNATEENSSKSPNAIGQQASQPARIDPEFPPSTEELKSYKPFRHNEPDGKPHEVPDSVQEGLLDYDRNGYGAFRYNEPDGKPPIAADPVAANLRDYDYKGYWPFRYNEPDGKASETVDLSQESLWDYDKRSNEQSLPEGGSSQVSDLGRGSRPPQTPREHAQVIESSLSRTSQSQNTDLDRREDLDLLRPSDVRAASGILKHADKEPASERQKRRAALEEEYLTAQATGLHPEEAAAAEKIKESRRSYSRELNAAHSELSNHEAHARGKVNAKIAELDAVAKADGVRTMSDPMAKSELTGNFVRDFPEGISTSWSSTGSSSSLVPDSTAGPGASGNDYTSGTAARENYSRNPDSPRIQTSLDRTTRSTKKETEHDSYTKEPRGLELSFFKERTENSERVPHVIVSSYGGLDASKSSERASKLEEQKRKNEQKKKDTELVREVRRIYESSYGAIDCNHRQAKSAPVDHSVADPAAPGLEVSRSAISEQKSDRNQNEYERSRNTRMSEPTAETAAPAATLYKILAYDATMQEINTAETTSIVEDTSSALTPAEVLLRLSNPAKFFPHFQPLQAQGYEIVSGSGDVLVFRKVRTEVPAAPTATATKVLDAETKDMPEPAAGNFASPIGFVNHDAPRPFKSGIDVRREELVFSGRSSGWSKDEKEKSKGGARRRLLIGAAWVAACSYAAGVVSEFFRTGGIDGTGPTGL